MASGNVFPGRGKLLFLIGALVGLVLTAYGVTSVIPSAGIFGFAWTAIGVLIILAHAYSLTFGYRRPPGSQPGRDSDIEGPQGRDISRGR